MTCFVSLYFLIGHNFLGRGFAMNVG